MSEHDAKQHDKQAISTAGAPKAAAAYSQGIIVNGLIFTAGQVALDPLSGDLIAGGIIEQTRRVLDNLIAVLESAGSSLNRVVKVSIFLRDINDFAAMNGVYAEYFDPAKLSAPLPARTTVQATIPRGGLIEMDLIALV